MRRAALLLLLLSHTRTTDDLLSAQSRLEDTPEIASWLCSVCPQTKVTIGNYTYLDGPCDAKIMRPTARVLARSPPPSPAHISPLQRHDVTQHELANLSDDSATPLPYSTYSLTSNLAKKVGGWDPDWISEDWHMFLKCFLGTVSD